MIYSEYDGQRKKPLKKPLLRKRERKKPELNSDTPTTLFIASDFEVFLDFAEVLV